jgi:predicted MFS family arabinose efflux permease
MLRSREGLHMVGSLASLIWLTLGAFAIGTEGFMIVGLRGP